MESKQYQTGSNNSNNKPTWTEGDQDYFNKIKARADATKWDTGESHEELNERNERKARPDFKIDSQQERQDRFQLTFLFLTTVTAESLGGPPL